MTVVFSEQAEDDLDACLSHIRERNPAAALKMARKVLAAVSLLSTGNVDGPSVRLSTGETVRGWLVSPFRVYYARVGAELRVLRIYHHARRPL
jgi:plasmid stabilization system protein ParE